MRRKRDRVVAEITSAYLMQVVAEYGRHLNQEQALNFLNQEGRAYEMWKQMMYAGENYIKSSLAQPSQPSADKSKSDSLARPGIPVFGGPA
ncbi:MAG TPA: hypothetical protein VMI10_14780 [Terriglobales bacterium]|nr:hypothetical protein [Terriglobales bacterium]